MHAEVALKQCNQNFSLGRLGHRLETYKTGIQVLVAKYRQLLIPNLATNVFEAFVLQFDYSLN